MLSFALLTHVLIAGSPNAKLLTVIDPPASDRSLAPNLRAAGDRLLLTWLERTDGDGITPRHRLRLSTYEGASWTPAVTIHESEQIFANWADVPSVHVTPQGGWLAHWAEKVGAEPYAYEVALARSGDGKTWKRIAPANDDKTATEHGFVSMTVERGGVRAFWLDGREMADGKKGSMTLRSAVFGDGTATTEVLDARVCDCCGTAAVATDEGSLIVYRDRDEDELRDISIVRRVKNRWTSPSLVHRDGWKIAGCPVNGPSVDARGRHVAVAWFTAAGAPEVRVAFSEDAGATFAAPIRVDTAPKKETLGRVDLTIDDDGSAIVAWLDALDDTNAMIRARRIAPNGASGDAIDAVETVTARASGFPQLVRSGDDLILAWTEVGPPSRVRAAKLSRSRVPSVSSRRESGEPSAPAAAIVSYSALDLTKKPVSLADFSGAPVLLNVWATWCAPCRKEIPLLNTIHAKYDSRGLKTIGVSVDEEHAFAAVERFVRDAKVAYTIWHDPKNKAQSAFDAPVLPKTVLIDRSGRILWSFAGAIDQELPKLEAAIERALKK